MGFARPRRLISFLILSIAILGSFQNCGRQVGESSLDSSTLWSSVEIAKHLQLNDDLTYWTVEPSGWLGGGEQPKSLPLVIFNHGWGSNDADKYKEWLTHLARQGNVIVFPKYQNTLTLPAFFSDNAMKSVRMAIDSGFSNVQPDVAAGMTIFSYSAGGLVSANMANRYASMNLPKPVALIALFPWNDSTLDASLSNIPASTRLFCLVGDEDANVGRTGCDAIWDRTNHIVNRSYAWMFSDRNASPPLIANHFAVEDSRLWKYASDSLAVEPSPSSSLKIQIQPSKITCPDGSKAVGCIP